MKVTFKLDKKAFKGQEKRLEGMISDINPLSMKLLKEDAYKIMAESLEQVPVDTGALQNSGYVEETYTFRGPQVRFGYGGAHAQVNPKTGKPTSQYMRSVHEDVLVHHKEGKAKFLEDPINNYRAKDRNNFLGRMAKLIRKTWRRK